MEARKMNRNWGMREKTEELKKQRKKKYSCKVLQRFKSLLITGKQPFL